MQEKRKIVLLFYPRTTNTSWYTVPLSLLAIGSQLDKKKYKIIIIDANIEPKYNKKILKLLKERKQDILAVGISSMTGCQIEGTLEISKLVKKNAPRIPVIFGGWHGSILPEQTLKNKYIDFVVRAQGEITFKELLIALEQKKDFTEIDGLSYKKGSRIYHNKSRSFTDVNTFLPMDYSLINVEKYIMKTDFGERAINYTSSYGCPYNCGFCAEPIVNKGKWSGLSAKRILDEIENLVKSYKLDSIFFDDNNFFVDNKRVIDFCKGLIKRKLNINWGPVNGRVDCLLRLTDEEWALLKKSSLKTIIIGAESGSDKVLELINKRISVDDTIQVLKKAKKYEISIESLLMVGLPKEPEEDLNKTLEFIQKAHTISPNNKVSIFFYTPYPGTHLFNMALMYGLKTPKKLEDWSRYNLRQGVTPWLSKSYRKKLRVILGYYLFFTFLSKNSRFIIKKGGMKGAILKLLNKLALYRWKRKNFSFPLEYYFFTLLRRFLT